MHRYFILSHSSHQTVIVTLSICSSLNAYRFITLLFSLPFYRLIFINDISLLSPPHAIIVTLSALQPHKSKLRDALSLSPSSLVAMTTSSMSHCAT